MRKVLLSLALLSVIAVPAFAATDDNPYPSPWVGKDTYGAQVSSKLGYGAKNLFLGWTELFTEPFEQHSAWGILQGLGNAVSDTVGGALHVITFPVTKVDVPLPENGVNFETGDM